MVRQSDCLKKICVLSSAAATTITFADINYDEDLVLLVNFGVENTYLVSSTAEETNVLIDCACLNCGCRPRLDQQFLGRVISRR